jgi:hypothetical protein
MSSLSSLDIQKVSSSLNSTAVWQQDEVSPASFLHSYKKNVLLQWRPESTTRVLPISAISDPSPQLEVILHQDDSMVFIRDNGKFLTHYKYNDMQTGLLR